MQYTIRIKRCKKQGEQPYFQSFIFEGTGEETIAAVLSKLNSDDLFDVDGKSAEKIIWSNSCNQGICGACSMVINGRPALACKTKLNSLKGNIINLEPLSKFPIITDLETDRTSLYQAPILHGIYNNGPATISAKQYDLQYEASKCMKCGICVEVCPEANIDIRNLGAVFAVDCYLKFVQNEKEDDKKRIKKEYNKNFASGCSKSMACMDLCPAKIDIRKILNHMNR